MSKERPSEKAMRLSAPQQVTANLKTRLYTIPAGGGGYSCLGFDVLENRGVKLAAELDKPWSKPDFSTVEKAMLAYNAYELLIEQARQIHKTIGRKFTCELTPELIGLEGKRVEVVDCWGEKRRFYVGKSTGFIQIHLEIARRDSTGGGAAIGSPYKSIRVIEGKARY